MHHARNAQRSIGSTTRIAAPLRAAGQTRMPPRSFVVATAGGGLS